MNVRSIILLFLILILIFIPTLGGIYLLCTSSQKKKNKEKFYSRFKNIKIFPGKYFEFPQDSPELNYNKYSGHRYKDRRRYNFKRYY